MAPGFVGEDLSEKKGEEAASCYFITRLVASVSRMTTQSLQELSNVFGRRNHMLVVLRTPC